MTAQRREKKIEESERVIQQSYYKNSLIEKLVEVRVSNDPDQMFLKLGRRIYIPEEWYSREDIYYDVALKQLGEGIARSERSFIINEILKNDKIERTKVEGINANTFKKLISDFGTVFRPTILFAPVEYFVDLSYNWPKEDCDFKPFGYEKIQVLTKNYEVFWSNKYTPFDAFIFANKDYGEWLTKPSLDKRFYVKISESQKPEKLELTMYTLFKFSITNPKEIRIVESAKPKTVG